jgi:hypothetical protein
VAANVSALEKAFIASVGEASMDGGDLVLTIIALIGIISAAAVVAADEWRNRSRPTETPKGTASRGT